ncbi:hypothetical protein R4P47_19880 [Rhodococcus sp. IEGM 1370]|uniref:hypothetical protein n=1 Tax=Rhodococcus sp. IEGM 1370 TaxID=3082222 RepID=UPI0029553A92|nr:hypothetical protein [Rhodococcus sp. IEGM 1370]MDV8078831.1 hypothetical protein [Rhodococcus sp. IEGM 1370]
MTVEDAITFSFEPIEPPRIEELPLRWEYVTDEKTGESVRHITESKPVREWCVWIEFDPTIGELEFWTPWAKWHKRFTVTGIMSAAVTDLANAISANIPHPRWSRTIVDEPRRCAMTFWADADDPEDVLIELMDLAHEIRWELSAEVEERLARQAENFEEQVIEERGNYEQQMFLKRNPVDPEHEKAISDALAALLRDWNLKGGVTGYADTQKPPALN